MITILKKDYIYYLILIMTIIFSIIRMYIFSPHSVYDGTETNFEGNIIKIDIDGNKLSITITSKEKLVGTYYIKTIDEKKYIKNNYKLGDKVKIIGTLNHAKNNTIPNLFNYKNYLYNNSIFWTISIDNIDKFKSNDNIFLKVKNYFIDRIDKMKNTKEYLYAFILGDSNKIDYKVKDSYQNNGISHLFAVSGMHVSLFMGMILFILKKLKIKEIINYSIAILFLLFYMFITNFSPSILRAGILFILLSINKVFGLNLKTINIMIILLSISLIINPFLIFNLGFQFSYVISLFLIIFQSIISRQDNYIKQLFTVSIISFLAGLPISIYNFYQINLLGVLLNLLFVPLVSYVIFPLSLISFICPLFDNILGFLIDIMEYLSLLFDEIETLKIILSKPPFQIIILYYFSIILILIKLGEKKYKYFLLLILMILIHNNISYFNSDTIVTMLDQTTTNMIQGLKGIFARKPLISIGI